MKKIFYIFLCVSSLTQANIGPQGFKQFLNYYFVETGTFGGYALDRALREGFQEVRSIEWDGGLYNDVVKKYRGNNRVRLWRGNSATGLWDMIKDIDKPITFWLDAHIFPPLADGGKNCPLIEELEQIKRHPIKTHTILIDDMHCAGSQSFDYLTKQDLINKLLEINPNYRIFYVPGGDAGEYPQNVMVARVE